MKKALFIAILFTACKVEKQYKFKPGDIVKVQNTRFLILDYKSRKGIFYKAKDLKHNNFVEFFSQGRF